MNDGSVPSAPRIEPQAAASKDRPSPNATATWLFPLPDAGLSIRNDHRCSDGTSSAYASGVCTVDLPILVDGTGDNVGGFDYPKGQCACTWTVVYPDSYSETLAYGADLHALETTGFAIPIGSTMRMHFRINSVRSDPSTGRCAAAWCSARTGRPARVATALR